MKWWSLKYEHIQIQNRSKMMKSMRLLHSFFQLELWEASPSRWGNLWKDVTRQCSLPAECCKFQEKNWYLTCRGVQHLEVYWRVSNATGQVMYFFSASWLRLCSVWIDLWRSYECDSNVLWFGINFRFILYPDLLLHRCIHLVMTSLTSQTQPSRWIMAIHAMARWHVAICCVMASAAPVTFKDDQLVKGRMKDAKWM